MAAASGPPPPPVGRGSGGRGEAEDSIVVGQSSAAAAAAGAAIDLVPLPSPLPAARDSPQLPAPRHSPHLPQDAAPAGPPAADEAAAAALPADLPAALPGPLPSALPAALPSPLPAVLPGPLPAARPSPQPRESTSSGSAAFEGEGAFGGAATALHPQAALGGGGGGGNGGARHGGGIPRPPTISLIMELVEGGNLAERIHAPNAPPMDLLEVLQVRGGRRVCHAVIPRRVCEGAPPVILKPNSYPCAKPRVDALCAYPVCKPLAHVMEGLSGETVESPSSSATCLLLRVLPPPLHCCPCRWRMTLPRGSHTCTPTSSTATSRYVLGGGGEGGALLGRGIAGMGQPL